MKKILLTIVALMAFVAIDAQLPQLKVDISMNNRQEQEVNEPGFLYWDFNKDVTTLTKEFDGITVTIARPADTDYLLRSDWSKTFIQKAEYKEKNGRLLFDGVVIDPNQCGAIDFKIKGLPAGQHSLQTYHNRWREAEKYVGWPINVKVNGGADNTGNAMGCTGADHTIIDHTTAAWGTDETFSSRGAKNISFQFSMIAEALGIADHKNYGSGTNHGYAATIDGKIGTYSHNLLAHCNGRNWSMGGGMDGENRAIGQMDIFNNVVYNWNGRTTDGNCHELNFVNNYYKMGPDTKRKELLILQYENVGHAESTWQAYVSGNIRENKNHTLTQDKLNETYKIQLSNGDPGPQSKGYEPFVNTPFFPSYATIHSAEDALKIVTSAAGATMPCRDDQHLRIIRETVEGTYTYVGSKSGIKGEIDREADCGGYEVYPEETRTADFDTDQDGMPNWYEELIGSDPNTANNNDDPDHDGYTLLEDYLEFMAHPYLVIKAGESETFDVSQEFRGFTKSPVYTYEPVGADLVSARLDGNTLTVNANKKGLTSIILKVKDADGTEWQQTLNIAITDNPAAINTIWSEDGLDIAKREFFTLDGKNVKTLQQHETYIMRLTDKSGKTHSLKIIY